MIASIGDLVDDIVVRVHATVAAATDTPSTIRRRRGGSAANVAVAVAALHHPARFIGRVGDDTTGRELVIELQSAGVDAVVQRGGRSGSIIVILDASGERTMLTDRGSCADLAPPIRSWLDGVDALHVPLYSLAEGALADTSAQLVGWAHDAGLLVSLDASSASLIQSLGAADARQRIQRCRPHVLFGNELELAALGGSASLAELVVVKRGAQPTRLVLVHGPATTIEVPPLRDVRDTTGAGDAFAAGFLVARLGGTDDRGAVQAAQRSAAAAIVAASGAR